MIPEHLVEEVRQRADIVAIIGEHVPLKRAGGTWKACCPFHEERTPSFFVVPDKQIFKCHGCGEGGDVFAFLMKRLGLQFHEAVRHVADRVGVSIPSSHQRAADPHASLYQAIALAQEFYQSNLLSPDAAQVRAYLESRGIDLERARELGIGYAPAGWDALWQHLRKHGVDKKVALGAGLVRMGKRGFRDCLRDRITFPIRDASGRIVAFGGRILMANENQPKYLNTPETPIFQKGRLLYGFDRAKHAISRTGEAILVEGYTDVISLSLAGVENVVAPLGTALTEHHADLLRQRGANTVYMAFDGDEAGLRATFRNARAVLEKGIVPQVIILPDGEDPDSFVRKHGAEAFMKALGQARDLVAFQIDILERAGWLDNPRDRRRAVERVLETIRSTADPILRDLYIGEAMSRLGVGREAVARALGLKPEDLPVPTIAAVVRDAESRDDPASNVSESDGAANVESAAQSPANEERALESLLPRVEVSSSKLRAHLAEHGTPPDALRGRDGRLYLPVGSVESYDALDGRLCALASFDGPVPIVAVETPADGCVHLYAPAGSLIRLGFEADEKIVAISEEGVLREPTSIEVSLVRRLGGESVSLVRVGARQTVGERSATAERPSASSPSATAGPPAEPSSALSAPSPDHDPTPSAHPDDLLAEYRSVRNRVEWLEEYYIDEVVDGLPRSVVLERERARLAELEAAMRTAGISIPQPEPSLEESEEPYVDFHEEIDPPAEEIVADEVVEKETVKNEMNDGWSEKISSEVVTEPVSDPALGEFAVSDPPAPSRSSTPRVFAEPVTHCDGINLSNWRRRARSGAFFAQAVIMAGIDSEDELTARGMEKLGFCLAISRDGGFMIPAWGLDEMEAQMKGPLADRVRSVVRFKIDGRTYYGRLTSDNTVRVVSRYGKLETSPEICGIVAGYFGVQYDSPERSRAADRQEPMPAEQGISMDPAAERSLLAVPSRSIRSYARRA